MQEAIYQEKPLEERLIFLRDTCDKVEKFSYEKAFTNQDVALFSERLSTLMIQMEKMQMELDRIKKDHSEKVKPMKVELKTLMDNINYRARMVEENAYIFIDHEKNMVYYYSSEGIRIHKRMLRIDEHQRSIMGAIRREDIIPDPEVVDESWERDEEVEYATIEDAREDKPIRMNIPQKKHNNKRR